MVVSIVSIVLACCCSPLGVVGGVVGTLLGHQAKGEIAASGGHQGGESQAQAGFVVGLVAIALGGVFFVLNLVIGFADFTYQFDSN